MPAEWPWKCRKELSDCRAHAQHIRRRVNLRCGGFFVCFKFATAVHWDDDCHYTNTTEAIDAKSISCEDRSSLRSECARAIDGTY